MNEDNKIYISLSNLTHVVTSLEETISQTIIHDVNRLSWTRLTAYLYLISQELQRTLEHLEKE